MYYFGTCSETLCKIAIILTAVLIQWTPGPYWLDEQIYKAEGFPLGMMAEILSLGISSCTTHHWMPVKRCAAAAAAKSLQSCPTLCDPIDGRVYILLFLQYSCLANPMNRGAWQATVHGVANSRTQLND